VHELEKAWRIGTHEELRGIKTLPDQQMLHDIYTYKNGFLIHRKNGQIVGWKEKNGYWVTNTGGTRFRLHRLIFQYHYGWCPEFLDHIDGNKENNKIENLRPATSRQNSFNKGPNCKNKLGVKGVCIERGRYKANIKIHGKSKHIGYFDTLEQAKAAYEEYAKKIQGEYSYAKRDGLHEGLRKSGMATEIQRESIDSWLQQSVSLVAGSVRGLAENQRRIRYFGFETTHEQDKK
jgi:hypothetical protein